MQGASRDAPKAILRKPLEAWSVDLEHPITARPIVGNRHVVVAVDKGNGKCALVVLDLRSGEELDEVSIASSQPLRPVGEGDWVAVPIGEDKVVVYRWTGRELKRIRSTAMGGTVDVLKIQDGELFLGGTFGAVRQGLRSSHAEWTAMGSYVGACAVHDDLVYFVKGSAGGPSKLVGLDRATGEMQEEVPIGVLPRQLDDLHVSVTADGVWVGGAGPMLLDGYQGMTAGPGLHMPRPLMEGSPVNGFVNRHATAPAVWRDGWVGYLQHEKGMLLYCTPKAGEEQVIAAETEGSRFFEGPLRAPVVLGDVLYLGGAALELPSQRILWRRDVLPRFQPAVIGTTVVIVEGSSQLIALTGSPPWRDSYLHAGDAETRFEGTAFDNENTLVSAEFGIDTAAGELITVQRNGKERRASLRDMRMVENAAGGVLYAENPVEFAATLHDRLHAELARDYADLAYDARSTNDVALMGELLRTAELHGSSEPRLDKVRDAIAKLEKRPKGRVARKADAIVERRSALPSFDARAWRIVGSLPAEAPLVMQVAGLRKILSESPQHPEATAVVRELLPEGLDPGKDFRAADWLDFVVASKRSPVQFVPQPKSEAEADPDQVKLGRALHMGWRDDLFGIRSENLLIITPVARPASLTRCLLTGELVCEALESYFVEDDEARNTRDPLILFLYPTKEEYLEQSAHIAGEAGSGLSWTSGHYDGNSNVSRIFLPEGDEDFEAVLHTYAHELAHHWIMARCPRFKTGDTHEQRPGLPGYWIVEGFASMIEGFAFDTTAWTWDPLFERAERLDTVASADPKQLLRWKRVFRTSRFSFEKIGKLPEAAVPLSWRIGWKSQLSETNFFYAQSAAACTYLFLAEDGRHREALIDYLVDYYTGQADGLDIEEAFGMSADELGDAAEAFAASVVHGGRK
tara:strand:- start:2092 stop:4842 length:2751 start_codon:yes stop_codon:yes gene_type:complete